MATLPDIVAYILDRYPHKSELSNARVTKMVYLSDWCSAIRNERQISGIQWYFDNYGPFVWDVQRAVQENPQFFRAESVANYFGSPKTLFKLVASPARSTLTEKDCEAINHVIETTKTLNWDSFIQLVYSTHPIVTTPRYSFLDLVEKAREYRAIA